MSWSISVIGSPVNVVKALEEQSAKETGQSKAEYDDALPHLVALVKQNFTEPANQAPTIELSASGSGYCREGQQVNRACSVSLKQLYTRIVGSLLPLLILLGCAADVSACHRCGLFGNRCRFAIQQVAVPYVAPATQTNFLFNNVYPTPYLLSPQGNSVYGYQVASQSQQIDPALYLDRASRFTEQALALAQEGNQSFSSNLSLAMQLDEARDRHRSNTLLALSAIEANRGAAGPVGYSATVQGGRLSITAIEPGQGATLGGQLAQQQTMTSGICSRCHDGRGTNNAPKALVLDGTVKLSSQQLEAAINRIVAGTMPPKSQLTLPQQSSVIVSLSKLLDDGGPVVAPQPVPQPVEVPPPPPQPALPLKPDAEGGGLQ